MTYTAAAEAFGNGEAARIAHHATNPNLERDDFRLNRHRALTFCRSTISS
jgi:hypothetical protein